MFTPSAIRWQSYRDLLDPFAHADQPQSLGVFGKQHALHLKGFIVVGEGQLRVLRANSLWDDFWKSAA